MGDMTSNRPYLLRAFYDWILDNDCTPYIVVDAGMAHVQVPEQAVKDGQVVLNISPTAVQALDMTKQHVSFSARFGGVPFEVYVPMYAISAIYARENGAGTMFPPEDMDEQAPEHNTPELEDVSTETHEPDKPKEKEKLKKGSHLSLVK